MAGWIYCSWECFVFKTIISKRHYESYCISDISRIAQMDIVTTQKTGPRSTTPKFRGIKRVYKKTENDSYAGKRRTKYKTKSQLCWKSKPGQKNATIKNDQDETRDKTIWHKTQEDTGLNTWGDGEQVDAIRGGAGNHTNEETPGQEIKFLKQERTVTTK